MSLADHAVELAEASWLDREPEPTYWEPVTFKVGDRVRCVPSPECRVIPMADSPEAAMGVVGHAAWETGLTGEIVVAGREDHFDSQGHPYEVEFDEMQWIDGEWIDGGPYAAVELTPLPAEDADAATGREG